MGAITDRSEDYLSASDVAVVQFRRQMVKAVRAVQQGEKAIGTTEPHIPHVKLASFEGIVPKTTSWRTLGVAPEELALREAETSQVA
jgi:phthalate 4,5-dioxygenase oxygenase subunit